MFDIILLILSVLSLVAIVIIVGRKFPQLAQTNKKTIQQVREDATKYKIIGSRLERKIIKISSYIIKALRPIYVRIINLVKEIYEKVVHLEKQYTKMSNQKKNGVIDPQAHTQFTLSSEIDGLIEQEEYEQAEKKLIELISNDSREVEPYRRLGELYMTIKDLEQAKETFEYILTLDMKHKEESEVIDGSDDADVAADYINLGLVYRDLGLVDKALETIEKACQLEGNNPRNLDIFLETSIIAGNKISAWEAFDRLKKVNPENKKLEEFSVKIKELEKVTKIKSA
ncbi:tetratricopeptide repeat protein [Patescibacteria group bacterium]|nr:tetratricopeptide repeat protein [Patescibacteria group bacterium]MBU1891012.1 tetratricopeptide repeat protein [Patescibacteria group bacterium]